MAGIQKIDGVMFDLTGVLVQMGADGAVALPGALDAVRRLKNSGVKFRFVSNCTQGHRDMIVTTLQKMGFPLQPEDVFTPIPIITRLVREHNLRPYLLVHKDSLPDFTGIPTDNPNCVIIGDAQVNFSYENLNHAFHILLDTPNARLFALGSGKFYKLKEGLSLDTGPFTKALEYASGLTAEIIGKPSANFFQGALENMNVKPENAIMIGDDYETDMLGATGLGVKGVLVRTGKPPPDHLPPTQVVVDNVGQAVDWVLKQNATCKQAH